MSDTKTTQNLRSKQTQRSQNWKRQPRRSRNTSNYITRHQLNGGKFQVPSNPPDVTYQPWNNITLVHTFNSEFTLTPQKAIELIRDQIDPTGRGFNKTKTGDGRFVLQMRFHDVKGWNLSGRVIAFSATDFIDSQGAKGNREQLCGIVDTGTGPHVPAFGYTYPSGHRQHVLRADDEEGTIDVFTTSVGAADQAILYIRMSYRFDGPVKPPKLILKQDKVIHGININNRYQQATHEVMTEQQEILKTLTEMVDEVKQIIKNTEKPSLVKSVINGIEETAMVVASGAGVSAPTSVYDRLDDIRQALDACDRPAASCVVTDDEW